MRTAVKFTLLRIAALALVLIILTGCAGSRAQQASLYERLGGGPGIAKIVNDFIIAMASEDAVRPHFKNINIGGFRKRLENFLCVTADGPCKYTGRSMREAHATLSIERPAFNAIVEALMHALDNSGVAFADQNALLARLAMMESEVVSTRPFVPPTREVKPRMAPHVTP